MDLSHENQDSVSLDARRMQRMTADEANAVIALWQQERVEQTGLTDRPAVSDVAEGLEIPVEEVQRLLAQVRAPRRERRRSAEIPRQSVLLQRHHQSGPNFPHRWVETRPGIWEDLNELDPHVPTGAIAGGIILCLMLSTVVSVVALLGWILGHWGPQLTQ